MAEITETPVSDEAGMADLISSMMEPVGKTARAPKAPAQDDPTSEEPTVTQEEIESVLEEPNLEEEPDDSAADETESDVSDDDELASDEEDDEDDPLYDVTVDGEKKQVKLSELKQRYSGEGAIEKRLQQATELGKANLEQLTTNRNYLSTMVEALAPMLFEPQFGPPDPSLAETDMVQYLAHKDAYRTEQENAKIRQQSVIGAIKKAQEAQDHQIAQIRANEVELLKRKMPFLADPVKGQQFQHDLYEFGQSLGIDKKTVDSIIDHRIIMVAAQAMKYRKLTQAKRVEPTVQKVRNVPEKARPSRASLAQKHRRSAEARAQKTGKPEDIALTMFSPRNKRD